MLKLDFENAIDEHNEKEANKIIGEFRRRRELKAKYTRMIWRAVFIFIGIVVSYPIVIMIIDLFYGN